MHTLTRRDIRRAVGPEALAVIQNQQQQIQVLTAQVNALTAETARLRDAISNETTQWYRDLRDNHTAFVSRPFLARLRWLVTGR